jgi:lipid II:glycine glycyltransferase (peptidoglycan interpeptide bridge formation enzyme)
MHGKHRNVVRKAQKAGVAIEVMPAPDELSAFAALYEQTMRRQDASDYYFFPDEYWERLTALGDRLVRFDAAHEGVIVASALCLRGDRWLHYHLGATADSARDLGASNLLLYAAALWGQGQGLEEFHLGGGARSEDSLFAFKQRFSPEGRREFWVGKLVHDDEAYRSLSGGAVIDYDGFFPAYRGSS